MTTTAGCGSTQGPWRSQGVRTVTSSACALEAPELRAQITVSQRGEVTARLERRCVRQVTRKRIEAATVRARDQRTREVQRELPAYTERETVWLPVALSPGLLPPWGGVVKGDRVGAAVRYQIDWSEVPSLQPSSVQRVWRLQIPGGLEVGWVPSEVEAFRLLSAATTAATAPAGAPSAATSQP